METTETGPGACPHVDTYDPLSAGHVADPEAVWRRLRRDTPVFFSPVQNAFVVTRHADACEVYADPETFSSAGFLVPIRPNPPEVDAVLAEGLPLKELGAMVMVDEPRHSELRRPLNQWFTPKSVATYGPDIRKLARELIEGFVPGRIEIVSAYSYPLALGVMLDLLGIPREHTAQIREWVNKRVALMWGDLSPDDHVEAARSFIEFQRYLRDLLEDRRREPHDDLVSQFARQGTDEGRPLTDVEIVGQMIGFLSAGHEMTTSAITFGLANLLEVPSRWEEFTADPDSTGAGVVEETIRYQGPSFSVWRLATRDTEIAGVPIPAGSRVSVLNGSANRDDNAFEDPDAFDVHRRPETPHLGFGRGIHFCLGAHLARLEVRVALTELARSVPTLRLPVGETVRLMPNVTLRLPESLHLEWDLAT